MTTTQLRSHLIDIWGKNQFPDIAVSLFGYYILGATLDNMPGYSDVMVPGPEKVADIDPDEYSFDQISLNDLPLSELLTSKGLDCFTRYLQNVLRTWNSSERPIVQGTLRLMTHLHYVDSTLKWDLFPVLICMRKVKNDD